jgi:hypothetical protein
MTIRKRMVLPLALALGAVGIMVMASMANAGHPRPKGATPLRASLVPAYNQCSPAAANREHGPPLIFPSCNPPVQSSGFLTVGSPDAGGGTANSEGYVLLRVKVGAPGPPEDSDVLIDSVITDVRCKPATPPLTCGSANNANGPDYTGELQGNATIRISDHWNAVAPGGGPDPATVVDIPFPVDSPPCTGTPTNLGIGSTCTTSTTANAVVEGAVKDGKRAVVGIGQLQIFDGGGDGQAVSTTGNTLFETQGIFIP